MKQTTFSLAEIFSSSLPTEATSNDLKINTKMFWLCSAKMTSQLRIWNKTKAEFEVLVSVYCPEPHIYIYIYCYGPYIPYILELPCLSFRQEKVSHHLAIYASSLCPWSMLLAFGSNAD